MASKLFKLLLKEIGPITGRLVILCFILIVIGLIQKSVFMVLGIETILIGIMIIYYIWVIGK